MHIEDASPTNAPFSLLKTVHDGQEITWSLAFYARPTNADVTSVFRLINGYWASLSAETQDQLFKTYEQAKYILDHVVDPTLMHMRLTETCKTLYQLMPFEHLQAWSVRHADIKVPPTIRDNYGDLEISARNQNGVDYESRTYLRKDYLELVDLGIFLKPMIPIWSEYIMVLTQIKSNLNFKEYQAMSLLRTSPVVRLEPMDRLRDYIETSAPEIKTQLSSTLGGLGSSELPDWLMSLAILRKLIIIELSSHQDSGNVISVIYHHVRNTLKSLDRKFTGRIKPKAKPTGDDADDSKSVLESYKIKQEVSVGDLVVLSVYTENYHHMAERIAPGIPKEMVDACAKHRREIESHQLCYAQLTLIRWMVSAVIPPRSIDNISRVSLVSCQVACQAALWYLGYPDLALMISASEVKDSEGNLLGGFESRSRIPKEYVDRFLIYYPHYQESGSKERDRQVNVACRAIDSVAKNFVRCDWHTKAPRALQELGTDVDDRGIMCPPSDIKLQLSNLIVHLATTRDPQLLTQLT